MTDHNSVLLEKRGSAFWITINRPEKRNALNGEVIAGIAAGYRRAHDDPAVRVIVLTGTGDNWTIPCLFPQTLLCGISSIPFISNPIDWSSNRRASLGL